MRSTASCWRSSACAFAAPRRGSSSATSIRTRTSSCISFASSTGKASRSATTGRPSHGRRPGRFDVAPLLPANTQVLRALLLPAVYGITMAEAHGEAVFLERARAALDGGLALVQLREKDWPVERQHALADALVALARSRGAKVLLNGDARHARAWGCDGVHWTSAALANAAERPEGLLCAASCHTRADIERAGALMLDFAVLGPVLPTPSHPGAETLGWEGFAALATQAPLPIFALGGLTRADLDVAIAHGAHGVALRRAAWT